MVWIILPILLLATIVFVYIYKKNRVATNFNLIYIRALRVEKNKEIAIAEALRYIGTFLHPFERLTDQNIRMIAEVFCEIQEPHKALQPLIQNAEKTNSIENLINRDHLIGWREIWQKEIEG